MSHLIHLIYILTGFAIPLFPIQPNSAIRSFADGVQCRSDVCRFFKYMASAAVEGRQERKALIPNWTLHRIVFNCKRWENQMQRACDR